MKIQNTNSIEREPLKILVYGQAGSGKTTLARTLDKVLVVSFEAGLLSLHGTNINYIDATKDDTGNLIPKEMRIDRLFQIYQELQKPQLRETYDWLFLDSITEISQNLHEKLVAEFPDKKDTLVIWNEYSKRIRSLIKAFRDIPHYNVVMTALASVEKDENGRRFQAINMQGKISQDIAGYFDEVFYLLLTRSDDGKPTRSLVTQGNESIIAKDRSGKLNQFEPTDLNSIVAKIKGNITNNK